MWLEGQGGHHGGGSSGETTPSNIFFNIKIMALGAAHHCHHHHDLHHIIVSSYPFSTSLLSGLFPPSSPSRLLPPPPPILPLASFQKLTLHKLTLRTCSVSPVPCSPFLYHRLIWLRHPACTLQHLLTSHSFPSPGRATWNLLLLIIGLPSHFAAFDVSDVSRYTLCYVVSRPAISCM